MTKLIDLITADPWLAALVFLIVLPHLRAVFVRDAKPGTFAGVAVDAIDLLSGNYGKAKNAAKGQGKSRVPTLPLLLVAALLVALPLGGCASTWPKACDGWDPVQCRCRRVVLAVRAAAKPRPAGVVVPVCDGKDLPVRISADEVDW